MKVILPALMFVCFAVLSPAEEIKSADGKVIEAKVLRVFAESVVIDIGNKTYELPWEKLDPDCAARLRMEQWFELKGDRFTGHRSAATKGDLMIDGDTSVYLSASISPEEPNARHFSIMFTRSGPEFKWLRGLRQVRFLADGQPIMEVKSMIDSKVIGDQAFESAVMSFDLKGYSMLCKAGVVEMRIGEYELQMPKDVHARMKVLIKWWQDQMIGMIKSTGP